MRTSLNFSNKLRMLTQMENESKFQILQYDSLGGAIDVQIASGLNAMKESGIKLKQIRILLDDSGVKIQPETLSYMKGDINIHSKIGGVLGIGKKLISSKLTGETAFKPCYIGSGEIFLEPSFGYFALIELEDDEIVVDDRMFYACEEHIEIKVALQRNLSSALIGNEGFDQIELSGSGIVALEIPVPESEIFKCILINDTLKVNGDFAILRTRNIEFSVEKLSKSVAKLTNGEAFINTYSGSGEVWLIPTKNIYKKLKTKLIVESMQLKDASDSEVE